MLFSTIKIGLRFRRNHIIFENNCSAYYTRIVIYKKNGPRGLQILDKNVFEHNKKKKLKTFILGKNNAHSGLLSKKYNIQI